MERACPYSRALRAFPALAFPLGKETACKEIT